MITLSESPNNQMPKDLDPKNNICAVLKNEITGDKRWFFGSNIVTDDGDIYYAKKSAATPGIATNENFVQGRAQLRTGTVTPAKTNTYGYVSGTSAGGLNTSGGAIAASIKTIESNYPKTNDSDTDNSGRGADAVSYKYYWNTSAFNATGILGGAIHDNASPADATKLLTHWTFAASFSKTANDTLTLFVNHTMNGV